MLRGGVLGGVFLGVGKLMGGNLDGDGCRPGLEGVAVGPVEAGISSQSSPEMTFVFKKKGHSSQSIAKLSIASATNNTNQLCLNSD